MNSQPESKPQGSEQPKLKPCPFCGGEVALQPFTSGAAYFVVCPEESPCRRSRMLITIKEELLLEGVAIWNTREPEDDLTKSLEAEIAERDYLRTQLPYEFR